jgi:glutathione S-transferase
MKAWSRANAGSRLEHVARHLEHRDYLLGEHFTVADAYMFWALFVAPHGGISLDPYQPLRTYVDRIRNRPSVKAALAFELPLFMQESAAGNAPTSVLPDPAAALA